jgi:hypothetical protein
MEYQLKIFGLERMRKMRKFRNICLSVVALAMASSSQAVLFTWSGNSTVSGQTLSASADFTSVGNTLTIVLSNTSAQASNNPADTLGTLVWNMTGTTFSQPHASNNVDQGASTVRLNNALYTSAYDLDKEYMYNDAFTFQSVNFDHGISCVGLGVFATNNDTFYERMMGLGNAGSSPGDAFSISAPAGTQNAANNIPVVRNSVTFTVVANAPINLSDINSVNFSFGSGAQTNSVPEPATMAMLTIGVTALIRRRKK